jgi:hypothetical protein
MTIPPHLLDWETAMASAPETEQVLRNLQNEPCLDPADEREFFYSPLSIPRQIDE